VVRRHIRHNLRFRSTRKTRESQSRETRIVLELASLQKSFSQAIDRSLSSHTVLSEQA
jgi:hypothetical protein